LTRGDACQSSPAAATGRGDTDAIRGKHDSLHEEEEEEGGCSTGITASCRSHVLSRSRGAQGRRCSAAFFARLVRSSSLRSILLLFRSQGGARSWRAAPCLPRCGLRLRRVDSSSTVVLRAAVVLHGVSLDREERMAG
jgi:hypothetical protein